MRMNDWLQRFGLRISVAGFVALVLVGALAMYVGAGEATQQAAAVKKYPPYPDVWGYELQWPADYMRQSSITMYKMLNGDYVATYIKRWTEHKRSDDTIDVESDFAALSFFSGERMDFRKEELNRFGEKHRKGRVERGGPTTWALRDGTVIMTGGGGGGPCPNTLNKFLIVRNSKGEEIAQKQFVYVLDKPVQRPIPRPCERNFKLKGEQMSVRVQAVEPYIIPLEDGTFLLYDQGGNLILRFDREFSSKSDLINRKVFVVDHGALTQHLDEYFKEKGLDINDQTINDAVYDYIVHLRKVGIQ